MSSKYFYTTILSFSFGIFVGSFITTDWPFIACLTLISGCLGLWWLKNRRSVFSPSLLLLMLVIISFAGGLLRIELVSLLKPVSIFSNQLNEQLELTGVVISEPEITATSKKLTVQVEEELLLVTTDRFTNVNYGDNIQLRGKLSEPVAFMTDFGREFDYPSYLAVRGIFYTMSFAKVEVLETGKGNYFLAQLYAAKNQFLNALALELPEPEVSLGDGLLLGVKQALGSELEADFRTSGIIHIVVLSGYNLMLVGIFMMFLLSFIFNKRTSVIIGIVAIIAFAILVGLSATVVRATIMAVLVLITEAVGKRYQVLRSLFFAGAVMLLFNPLLLVHDVGFQLSFMATLGLLLISPILEVKFKVWPFQSVIKNFLLPTLSTQIMVLPILLYQIGQFSVVAIVVNLLVLPVVSIAMLMTFLTGLAHLVFAPFSKIFAFGAYFSLTYIINVVQFFAHLPGSAFVVPPFPFILVIICYACTFYYIYLKLRTRDDSIPEITLEADLKNWTIVEEVETNKMGNVIENKNTAPVRAVLKNDSDKNSLPIFFR